MSVVIRFFRLSSFSLYPQQLSVVVKSPTNRATLLATGGERPIELAYPRRSLCSFLCYVNTFFKQKKI